MKKAYLVASLAIISTGAIAKDPQFVVTKPVADAPVAKRDPAMGYVLLRSDRQAMMHLMKIASPEDQLVYDQMRATALAKEKKKYPAKLRSYRQSLEIYEMLRKSGGQSGKKPQEPVEPTEDNFVFPPFGVLAGVSIGPLKRFSKAEGGASVYLQSLTPGSYRIYGPLLVVPEGGATGACFCMGSVKFTVKAGEITDLGTQMLGGGMEPSRDAAAVDSRLKDWPWNPADYRAVGKLPNYYGVKLDRINAIPGVISYQRDQIIDLQQKPAVASAGTM